MKTIIYTGPFQLPDKNAAAHRVLNNAKILRSAGYNVVFVGLNPQTNVEFIKTQYEYEDFTIYELPGSNGSEKIKSFSCLKWFENLTRMYDIVAVIAYDYYAVGLYKLWKLCKKKRIAIIADTDEWFSASGNSFVEKIIRKSDSEMRMRFIQPKMDAVITISEFLYNYYRDKTITIRVPPLVDKSEKKWNIEQQAEQNNSIEIVYSGSPGTSKDKLDKVILLLSEVKASYEIKLTVLGITKDAFLELNPHCKEVVESCSDKFVFKGRVAHVEALRILQKSDFSMFLRDDNRVTKAGFPTKFVESISAGVPVITNNTSDLSDYIINGENGFLLTVDIKDGIKEIFQKDIIELKKIKAKVDNSLFDYQKYSYSFYKVLEVIEK